MKVLVFGGNRFVGRALIEKLLDQGYDVDMFNRSGTGPDYVMETCEANIYDFSNISAQVLDLLLFHFV